VGVDRSAADDARFQLDAKSVKLCYLFKRLGSFTGYLRPDAIAR
jgi:hypothetical protein